VVILGLRLVVLSDAGSNSGETAACVVRAAGGWFIGSTSELSLGAAVVRGVLMNNDTRRGGPAGSGPGHSDAIVGMNGPSAGFAGGANGRIANC